MVFRFWQVMDSAIVEACLAPALWSLGLIAAAVLLPSGSGLEAAASFFGFFCVVSLLLSLACAVWRGLRSDPPAPEPGTGP